MHLFCICRLSLWGRQAAKPKGRTGKFPGFPVGQSATECKDSVSDKNDSAKRVRIAERLTILLGCRKRKHSAPLLLLEDKSMDLNIGWKDYKCCELMKTERYDNKIECNKESVYSLNPAIFIFNLVGIVVVSFFWPLILARLEKTRYFPEISTIGKDNVSITHGKEWGCGKQTLSK